MRNNETDFDVVVVGAGGAGLAAACAAAETGARVVVIEKLQHLTGTTSWSVGSIAAAGTRLQRKAGILDTPEAFAEDMLLAHPQSEDAQHLRLMLARDAGATVDWLERIGVVFLGPFPEPPNRVPRMHNAVPAGRIYLQVMAGEARRLGVELRHGARATELIIENGEVHGVRYESEGGAQALRARSVILASGDYSASAELRAQHLTRSQAAAIPINANSTGDGHRMALQAGAGMKRMDGVFGPQLRFVAARSLPWIASLPDWRWLRRFGAALIRHAPPAVLGMLAKQLLVAHMSPSDALFEAGAVLVDASGDRVGASSKAGEALALRPGATGFVVGDAALAARFSRYPHFMSTAPGIAFAYFRDYERGRPDLVHWGADAKTLATQLGFDAAQFAQATSHLSGRMFALGPCQAMLTVTEGGASIDARGCVLDTAGKAISGLYAAGGNGQSGLMLKGHGLHLAWAMTSGRVAGASAGAQARIRPPSASYSG